MNTYTRISVFPETFDTRTIIHAPSPDRPLEECVSAVEAGALTLQFRSPHDALAWLDHCTLMLRAQWAKHVDTYDPPAVAK